MAINKVYEGYNKYCGPAILSALTGKTTDECAAVVSAVTGNYKVKGVLVSDLKRSLDRLGFTTSSMVQPVGTLFSTITHIINSDGTYVVVIKTGPKDSHYILLEVSNKQVLFVDNHTKEPIHASSSSRLSLQVLELFKVFPKPEFKTEVRKEVIETKTVKLNSNDICKLMGLDPLVTKVYIEYDFSNLYIDDIQPVIVTTETKTYE